MKRGRKRSAAPRPTWRSKLALAAFLCGCVTVGYLWGSLPDPSPLVREAPASTALIDARADEARAEGKTPRRRQQWVPLSHVAPHAVTLVVASEDDRFFDHAGVDLKETQAALEEAWARGKLGRGASTLTQQLAKNLWLSGDRSLLRKGKEWVLARRLEQRLGKQRILELYLNVAEWGDGIYGIEAAARAHFGVSASELSVAQAAVLAAMLPAPRTWTPASGAPKLRARSLALLERLERHGRLPPQVAAQAKAEVALLVGGVG